MEVDKKQSWKPLIAIALSMVMMYITTFGVNVLISAIVNDLKTTVANLQFVIVAASLIAGSLMVTAGRLGDKFGKKKIFVIGVIVYTIGLITVVFSPNVAVFTLAWAVIWPSGMVLIIPTSIALIMYFYEGGQRALAFGIYGAVLSAVSAIAPVVVGFLSDTLGWRLALSLSPIMGVVTVLFSLSLPETEKDSAVKIDIFSVILSVASFGLFLITTTMAGRFGWIFQKRPLVFNGYPIDLFGLSVVPLLYAVSAILLIVFFYRGSQLKKRGEVPLLDASLHKNAPFAIGMTIGALFFLVNAGYIFAVSVYLQAGVRFEGLQTALTTLPFSVVLAILSFATPGLGKKIASKWIVVAGAIVMGIGVFMAGQLADMKMTPIDLLLPMILAGAGSGLIMAQYTGITMMTVAPEQSGEASGLSETMKEIIGQGFAVALAGSVLFGAVYSSMVDDYAKLEGETLTKSEHIEIVIELEDTFQAISEEDEAKFVVSLPDKTKRAYRKIVESAGKKGLNAALMVMNVFLVVMAGLALLVPARKMD
ncbi:MAG: MFS transporter [Desulfobacterales bacterium]|jgi:MFS family permease